LGAELMAMQYKVHSRTHPDELRQCHHGDGRKTAKLDFRLAELCRLSREDEITKRGELHAAPEAVAVHGGNRQALGLGKPAKDGVKGRKHSLDELGSVVG